jgi:ABC-type dipeptide/oligopeptide/nickel transport system permease component
VAIVIFILLRLVPGDPALLILEGTEDSVGNYTQEDLDALRRELGTDRPIYAQFGVWVWGLVRGDLGRSLWDKVPVMDEIRNGSRSRYSWLSWRFSSR